MPAEMPSLEVDPPHEPSLSILVVEDDALIGSYIADILGAAGFTVAGVASTGEEALSIAAVSPADVALVDIRLAGALDGIEVAGKIRELHGIRTIFLSGLIDPATVDRAAVANPLGFLQKPFRPSQVFNALEGAMQELAVAKH